jgi:hypothetical protein
VAHTHLNPEVNMKRIILFTALAIYFIFLPQGKLLAGEAKAPWQQEWDNTLEAAKKDGKLVAGSRRIFAEEVFR